MADDKSIDAPQLDWAPYHRAYLYYSHSRHLATPDLWRNYFTEALKRSSDQTVTIERGSTRLLMVSVRGLVLRISGDLPYAFELELQDSDEGGPWSGLGGRQNRAKKSKRKNKSKRAFFLTPTVDLLT